MVFPRSWIQTKLPGRQKIRLSPFGIYYQNVRGLRTKIHDLRSAILLASESYDIIVLVETWLSNDILDAELGLNDYKLFRFDRNSDTSMYIRGEGILIAVNRRLPNRAIVTSISSVEQLFVNNNLKIYLS